MTRPSTAGMLLVGIYRTRGPIVGMHYLRREFARGEHNWKVLIRIFQDATEIVFDEDGQLLDEQLDDQELEVKEVSLAVARIAAMRAVAEIVPHDGPVNAAEFDIYVDRPRKPKGARRRG